MAEAGEDAGAPVSFEEGLTAARRTIARLEELRTRAETVSVTETSADGGIAVTVNTGGVITDLRITDRAASEPGARIAEQVLATMRRAQSRIAGRMDEVLRETAADDPGLRDRVRTVYQDRFPEPEPDWTAPVPKDHQMRIDLPADEADESGYGGPVLRDW